MKKQIFLFAVAALALASCSSENDVVQTPDVQQTAADNAVLFDVYMQRATTRAGVTGAVTTNDLKSTTTDLGKAGFGVFGYYTNSSTYDQQAIPNFFYNQQVNYKGSAWTYEPIKYWPNEYGSKAESDDADKVSYFAYAPYVSVNPSTGKPNETDDPDELSELQKWGITCMTTNSTMGDPMVKYIASFDQSKSVDLTWGVCDETNWQIIQTGAAQRPELIKGKPWLNVERPANVDQKVKFTFKHATAQLMVNIDAYVDGINNGNEIASGTKVYVRSITFEGLATRGALNLNNTEVKPDMAYWMDYNGTNDLAMGETVTIYDGRKDGKEGTPSGEANNEKSLGLNPNLIQSTVWNPETGSAMPGVTNVPQPLFRNGDAPATQPIYVIPTGDPVKVTITYDIETADNNLATYVSDAAQHGSSIENVISKSITFGKDGTEAIKAFENGKSYTINLHLGMNSVKFDAFVSDWIPQSAIDVDLPANIPSYQATGAGTPVTATVGADAISYQFAVTGLDPFETISSGTVDASYAPIAAGTYSATANASGVAIMPVTLVKNKTVKDVENATALALTAGTSGKKINLTVTQKAAPLGLTVHSLSTTDNKTFELHSTADETDWSGLTPDIKVWKNGIPLKASEYTVTPASSAGAKICDLILNDAVAPGDVYTFKVEAGNAPAETATARIAGIVYPTSKKLTYRKDAQDPILPTLYGPGENVVANYDWTAVTSGDIKVSTDGKITTDKATDTETAYTATLKAGYKTDATSKGWFFSSTSDNATLNLTADKQDVVATFIAPTIAAKAYTSSTGTFVYSSVASSFSFKGKLDTGVNAAEGLTVTYEIVTATKDGIKIENPSSLFTVNETNLVAGILESGQYVVTVKASLPTNDKFNETSVTGDFKFTAN